MTGRFCPLPDDGTGERIQLAHGEGGRRSRELLEREILPLFSIAPPALAGDACRLPTLGGVPVFTTDSFVVTPLIFPGGDIGSLAVHGTLNDLAVAGGRPLWLSLSLIIEEGLPLSLLRTILRSAAAAAADAGVRIVTGDTKVVPRGAADGLFLNTSGLGELVLDMPGPQGISPGDVLIVSGPIGRHGIAVMNARERLGFEPPPRSDCGNLTPVVEALAAEGLHPKSLRDCTRGGLAAVLHEWSASCERTMIIDGAALPVLAETRGVCELLGLDPLFIAGEGTLVLAVAPEVVERVLSALRRVPISQAATVIGEVVDRRGEPVVVRRPLGQLIPLDEPAGAPLPRIC